MEMNDRINVLKADAESREIKEKQLMTKVVKLREQRKQIKSQWEGVCSNLNEIFDFVSEIEV